MTTLRLDDPIKAERVQSRVQALRGWSYDGERNVITREYRFPNFRSAIAFVQYVAEQADAADHHPDIDVRYNRVTLSLSTHSAGGITDRDFDLAAAIDHLPQAPPAQP
jgi:4a-hydroxytetrahydrobiopterin dehydratase